MWTKIASASASAGGGATATTSAIDTTGADLLVITVSDYAAASTGDTVTDSKGGGTWTPLTNYAEGTGNITIFYKKNPNVGSGHTFSVTGSYTSFSVEAWSGADLTSPLDVTTGNHGSSGSPPLNLQTGSVTPSQNNSLIITGISTQIDTTSIDSGFTVENKILFGSVAGMADAYLVQATAAAINPTWTNGSAAYAAIIAVFKPAASATDANVTGIAATVTASAEIPAPSASSNVAHVAATATGAANPPVLSATSNVPGLRATASADGITPVVSAGSSVTATAAAAAAAAVSPAITAWSNVIGVKATATADAPVPAVTGQAAGSVDAVPAQATATALPPIASAGSVVQGTNAIAQAAGVAPTISGTAVVHCVAAAALARCPSPIFGEFILALVDARTLRVAAESRRFLVPAEDRTLRVS